MNAAHKERFWSKVRKTSGCWNWRAMTITAAKGDRGKFCVTVGGKRKIVGASRVAWMLTFGRIPRGQCVCHRCDNGRCVRPSHLFLGTHASNMSDAWKKGRLRGNGRPRLLTEREVFFSDAQWKRLTMIAKRKKMTRSAVLRQFVDGVS